MTRRPTKYQVMKRVLFAQKEYNEDFDGHDANQMIRQSCREAYEKLDDKDREHIDHNIGRLTSKIKNLSDNCALELLAAIGNLDLEVK